MNFENSNKPNKLSTNKHDEKRMWQLAVEMTNVGVWEFDTLNQKVYFSKASKRIIGFENDPTFGDHINDWNDRVHPDDREKYFQRSEEHTSELQSRPHLVCRLLLEKKKKNTNNKITHI